MAKNPVRAWNRDGSLVDREALARECSEAASHVVDDRGVVNWRAAFFADPGVTQCPGCGEYVMREGSILECPCGVVFDAWSKQPVERP